MSTKTTTVGGLDVTLIAHEDAQQRLLQATLSCNATARARTPLRLALIIDRSGSMQGDKLEITKRAAAKFVRSLRPEDQVAVITYDDQVNLICGLQPPSEDLERKIEAISAGGSTNLYGGWVMGAKLVGRGGRAILLSDGQANHGALTDAESLAAHSAKSYQTFGVTTTTVGVGQDYDEALMAGMARAGGGAHYFAHTSDAIERAFSQERHSAESVVIQQVSLRINGVTEQLGHFWSGETKKVVFAIPGLADLKATIRYGYEGSYPIAELELPERFGHSDEVTLEWLLQQAGRAQDEMVRVRDPRSAGQMRERLRAITLKLLAHPKADEPAVATQLERLSASIAKLEGLEQHYDEREATVHRKRSLQMSYNLRERAKAFSSFEEDQASVHGHVAAAMAPDHESWPTFDGTEVLPRERWSEWGVKVLGRRGDTIQVEMENPRDGFLVAELEKATGLQVLGVRTGRTADEIRREWTSS